MSSDAPGFGEIMTHFAFDAPWYGLLLAIAGFYVVAWLRVRSARPRVPPGGGRLAAFLLGILLIAVATQSPLEHYGAQLLWAGFASMLLLTMIAPPLILLGSPLTLAFRASSPRGRARLRGFYRGRVMRVVAMPIVSWLAFAIVTYAWQFTGLTEEAAANVFVRDVQQLSLLAVSLLFWWPALCADPVPWRMNHPLRVLYVAVEMTHKGLFGGMFLSLTTPVHETFAAAMPAWAPSAMMDQRLAILVLWVGGSLVFLVALAAIAVSWIRYEARQSTRVDRRLDALREARRQRERALGGVLECPGAGEAR